MRKVAHLTPQVRKVAHLCLPAKKGSAVPI
jgi:hypothetical protein